MVGAVQATSASGWGPMLRIRSVDSTAVEVIHSPRPQHRVHHHRLPEDLSNRVSIRRKGTRHDPAGAIYVEVPAGTGPQVATFLHTFAHLPGSVPPQLSASREALQDVPSRLETGGAASPSSSTLTITPTPNSIPMAKSRVT
jgi:hypothetical protein